MNLNINLNVAIDLSDEYLESRLDYFMQTIKTIQEKHNLTCTVQPVIKPKNYEIGPLEQEYLRISGRTRMNHSYTHMTREEQAEYYLNRMGNNHIKTDEDPIVLPIEENVNSDPLS